MVVTLLPNLGFQMWRGKKKKGYIPCSSYLYSCEKDHGSLYGQWQGGRSVTPLLTVLVLNSGAMLTRR